MKQIPENKEDIQKLLYEQIALLIKESYKCDPSGIRENIRLLLEVKGWLF